MFKNTLLKNIIIISLSISISLLSLYMMIGNITNIFKIITLLVSFSFSIIYLYKNYHLLQEQIPKNKLSIIISLILSCIIFYELTISPNMSEVIKRFYNIDKVYYLIFPGLYFIITITFIHIKNWLKKFFKEMSNNEKKIYIFTSIIMFILIFIIYSTTNYFYSQFDEIYSMDSGWIYENFIPNPHYYDIRHPITSILVFPIYAIINFIFNIQLKPIMLQFINIQLLIITGLELKRLTKNKWVFIFYMLSFPTILFLLFYEKYILSVFLMVTYLYNTFINKQNSHLVLILAIGTMPTNIFIALTELFRKISIKDKIKNINTISLIAILIIIVSGRIHCFTGCFNELIELKGKFGSHKFTTIEKFNSTTKMIEQSFIALPSSNHLYINNTTNETKNIYFWNNLTNSISYVAIGILAIIFIGIKDYYNKNKQVYLSFLTALAFSFILFIILNWATNESPLFSICFSWAIIPLFIYGLNKLFKLLKISKKYHKYIYSTLIILMTIINITGFTDMYKYIINI